jgi:glucose/arabinose dehydrogenase
VRLALKETPEGMRVAGEEFLLTELNGTRFRDVKQGPDGALYVMTDSRPPAPGSGSDKILRLVPKKR